MHFPIFHNNHFISFSLFLWNLLLLPLWPNDYTWNFTENIEAIRKELLYFSHHQIYQSPSLCTMPCALPLSQCSVHTSVYGASSLDKGFEFSASLLGMGVPQSSVFGHLLYLHLWPTPYLWVISPSTVALNATTTLLIQSFISNPGLSLELNYTPPSLPPLQLSCLQVHLHHRTGLLVAFLLLPPIHSLFSSQSDIFKA